MNSCYTHTCVCLWVGVYICKHKLLAYESWACSADIEQVSKWPEIKFCLPSPTHVCVSRVCVYACVVRVCGNKKILHLYRDINVQEYL